ncbi:MAG: DUF3085 domain-containing protein [Acidiferrobacter sp.]
MAGTRKTQFLTFRIKSVREALEHAKSCTKHAATFDLLLNPENYVGNKVVMAKGEYDVSQLKPGVLKPGLMLVKDHGVYLMTNGLPFKPGTYVVYADECNPETLSFDEWYNASIAIMGGDDSSETLSADLLETAMEGTKADESIRIAVSIDQLRIYAPTDFPVAKNKKQHA